MNTASIVPQAATHAVAQGGALLLVVVLAAVGLGVDVEGIRKMGLRPFLIGFALATTMAVISIGLIVLLGLAQ